MKLLAIEQDVPGVEPGQFKPHLKGEALKVWEHYQSGAIRESYFRADCSKAVLVLEAENVDEAKRILNTLPLVTEGLIRFDIIPLVPYPGFARLFASI
jgi:hypothetical protein